MGMLRYIMTAEETHDFLTGSGALPHDVQQVAQKMADDAGTIVRVYAANTERADSFPVDDIFPA